MKHDVLTDRVRSAIHRYRLIKKGDGIVIALSGGADSCALLAVLASLADEWSLRLHCAHLDHQLRADSARDAAFACERAGFHQVPITCETIDIAGFAEDQGLSIEEAARNERYRFLRSVADRIGVRTIAVGHHAGDQAETVLMRLIRGAGLLGLGGMPPKRTDQAIYTIIRPLIDCERRLIMTFLHEQGLSWREDASNTDTRFLRNRIRHELLPLLERDYNANIEHLLASVAENVREDYDYIERTARRRFRGLCRCQKPGSLLLDQTKLRKLSRAVQKQIIRCAIEDLKGNLRRITYQHWKEIEALLHQRPTHAEVHLPDGMLVVKKQTGLEISCVAPLESE